MKRYILFSSLVVLSVIITGCSAVQPPVGTIETPTQTRVTIPPGQFYFYSTGCAHCTTVTQYIQDNHVKEHLYFLEKEVSSDSNNLALAQTIGERCGIAAASLSVPLFWDGQRCYQGSAEVISYFENHR